MKYNYKNIVGVVLDTNQYVHTVSDVADAKIAVAKVIELYGEGILKQMFADGHRFSSFIKPNNFTLYDMLMAGTCKDLKYGDSIKILSFGYGVISGYTFGRYGQTSGNAIVYNADGETRFVNEDSIIKIRKT